MLSSALAACVKFEINPGNVVSDTVDAGKQLYQTVKRKRNGEEEREYTHIVAAKDESADTENTSRCKKQLEQDIQASSSKLSKVLSESSEVIEVDGQRKIRCITMALVVPN